LIDSKNNKEKKQYYFIYPEEGHLWEFREMNMVKLQDDAI
jgi:hypothetical protein